MTTSRKLSLLAVAALFTFGTACAKKKATSTPPPPSVPAVATARTPAPEPAATPARTPEPAAQPERPRYPDAATRARIDELLARIQDAYFDYDKHTLRPDALEALKGDSRELTDILRQYPDYKLTVEGYCDERGSAEYNMALGDKRAQTAKEYLANLGIPANQLSTVSYGKERQLCTEHDESCWQKNRRAHIVALAQN